MFCAMQQKKDKKKKTTTNKLLCVHCWNYKLLPNKMSTDLIYVEIPVQHSKLVTKLYFYLEKKLKRTNNWTEQLNDEQLNAPLLYLVEKVHWPFSRANAYLEDVSYLQILSDNPAACWYIYIYLYLNVRSFEFHKSAKEYVFIAEGSFIKLPMFLFFFLLNQYAI